MKSSIAGTSCNIAADCNFPPSRHAPIDPERLSRDPATIMPAEKRNAIRNLLGLADPAIGVHPRKRLQGLLGLVLHEQLRARRARGHRVDADALPSQVFRHDSDHLLDGALGGEVGEIGRHDRRRGR